MPVAHDALAARLGLEIGVSPEEVGDLRLDGLREQGTCPLRKISVSELVKVPG